MLTVLTDARLVGHRRPGGRRLRRAALASQSPGVSRNYLDLPDLLSDPELDACCPGPAGRRHGTRAGGGPCRPGLHTLLPEPLELGGRHGTAGARGG